MGKRSMIIFFSGICIGVASVSLLWYGNSQFNLMAEHPRQITFDAKIWRETGAAERGMMYVDLVRMLQTTRPSLQETRTMLGEPVYERNAYPNNAETCLVYNFDNGQRIFGFPFLNKLGVSFDKEGRYSDVTSWD
jgi:hypothetical protein